MFLLAILEVDPAQTLANYKRWWSHTHDSLEEYILLAQSVSRITTIVGHLDSFGALFALCASTSYFHSSIYKPFIYYAVEPQATDTFPERLFSKLIAQDILYFEE